MSSSGASFQTKTQRFGADNVDVQIWDSAGQERFQQYAQLYYKDAHGVAVIFDVSNNDSILKAKKLINDVKAINEQCYFAVIGNKMDLLSYEQIVKIELLRNEFAGEINSDKFSFGVVSAKTGQNVNQVFDQFCNQLYYNNIKNENKVHSKKAKRQKGLFGSCQSCKKNKLDYSQISETYV